MNVRNAGANLGKRCHTGLSRRTLGYLISKARLSIIGLTILYCISIFWCYTSGVTADFRDLKEIYLYTLRVSLTGSLLETPSILPAKHKSLDSLVQQEFNHTRREKGKDWPLYGLTMIGNMRLQNIQLVIENVVKKKIYGDFVECGVWRGGASIYARAVFNVLGERQRQVHLFDSYGGLPRNSTKHDEAFWSSMSYISVTYDEVQRHLQASGLFGNTMKMHAGFFNSSLMKWNRTIKRSIAVLRMDGDMFESTMDILFNLWQFVPKGGYIIVDDYHAVPVARSALEKFFMLQKVNPPLIPIDEDGVYFIKDGPLDIVQEAQEWYVNFQKSREYARRN